jgi:transposase-like protein
VQHAYVCGVSTRRVDQLVESLGLRISESEVSRIAGLLDEQVEAFRQRPLEGRYPYLFVDAKVEKVRDGGPVVRKCVVIAHAVHESGRREIIGFDVGAAESEAFWREFLRSMVARGLAGVQLAIRDAHPGLKAALAQVLGVLWQRCTVSFLRGLRGHARKVQHDVLGALIRPIFTAPEGVEARRRLGDAVGRLQRRLPKIAGLLEEAEEDILAFYAFPASHHSKLRSANPLERFNSGIGRRTDVVGIFPADRSLIRLISMLATEANDEWPLGKAYISQLSMATVLARAERGRSHGSAPAPPTPSPRRSRAPSGLSRPPHHRRHERQAPTPHPGTGLSLGRGGRTAHTKGPADESGREGSLGPRERGPSGYQGWVKRRRF